MSVDVKTYESIEEVMGHIQSLYGTVGPVMLVSKEELAKSDTAIADKINNELGGAVHEADKSLVILEGDFLTNVHSGEIYLDFADHTIHIFGVPSSLYEKLIPVFENIKPVEDKDGGT